MGKIGLKFPSSSVLDMRSMDCCVSDLGFGMGFGGGGTGGVINLLSMLEGSSIGFDCTDVEGGGVGRNRLCNLLLASAP